jgi:ribonuclease D
VHPIAYVRTSAELTDALRALSHTEYIALDTEFMRESTYYPKLCLIQVASGDYCFLIDPLALDDLRPFTTFLAARERIKVLHSARQDLEVLTGGDGNAVPGPIFDTQIAAGLLGYTAQIGYGALVEQRLGRTLAKGHTRTDWSQRPLSEEQVQYAADDARYLAPLYQDLRGALEIAGRLPWLLEETAELENAALYRVEPEQAWRRLKGLDRMRADQRATAKLLAQWRESMAIQRDKPRGWILSDETLRELAERLPGTMQALEQIRSLPPAVARKRGAELLELIAAGTANAANESETVNTRPEPQQLALVTRLMNEVRNRALDLKISPELLATRRAVEQLVFSGRTDALLNGWRRAVIGEHLVALTASAK